MDESAKQASPSIRHRLDSASAARSEGTGGRSEYDHIHRGGDEGHNVKPAYDGPRANSVRARDEMGQAAFGEEVRPIEHLGFADALRLLRGGERVARQGWHGEFVALAMTSMAYGRKIGNATVGSHLLLRETNGDLAPWTPTTGDLLAFDWCLVREEKVLVYGHGDATGPTCRENGAER